MTIITNDGVICAGTPEEIVTDLRHSQRLGAASDNQTYMASVASRVKLWNGEKLTYHDTASFLDGLWQAELIDVLES